MSYETRGLAPGLEDLVQVARQEQITWAADVLGVPQPTLSRSIARLSAAIGTPLIEKNGRGIRLTRHGRLLADRAERALSMIVDGLRTIDTETDPESGTVILGFLTSMGPALVPQLLQTFTAIKPRVTVQLVQHGTDELLAGAVNGSLDLCIVAPLQARVPAELESRSLAVEPLVLLVPDNHHLAGQRRVTIEQVRAERLITMHPGYGLRDLTDHLLDAGRHVPQYVFESQDIPTATGLVRAGLGVAVLPATTQTAETTAVPIDSPAAHRSIDAVWHQHRELTRAASDLLNHILSTAPTLLQRESEPRPGRQSC